MIVRCRSAALIVTLIVAFCARADTIHVPQDWPTIGLAVDAAVKGDVVVVSDGIWKGPGNRDIDTAGFAITIRSENGPNRCIIDAEGNREDPHRGFIFREGETSATIVRGFTIRNGFSLDPGGGILCKEAGPAIIDCIIRDNQTLAHGGGIACISDRDGGITPVLINCLFIANVGATGGGGMANRNAWTLVTNCTFTKNKAGADSGSAILNLAAAPVVRNTIFWDNIGGVPIVNREGFSPAVTYCDVRGGYDGEGNIDSDPRFASPSLGDFRLRAGSPCIDAGDNSALPSSVEFDLSARPRFVDDPDTQDTGRGQAPIVDMGAYEFQAGACEPCDANCDGSVDLTDVEPFIDLLLNGGQPCRPCTGDTNSDGSIDLLDVSGFIRCLL